VVKETKSNIDAAWNHAGNKFCVGAASGNVFIGKFSTANNFWVAMPISKHTSFKKVIIGGKKVLHKSGVVSVRFDPMCGRVCASASTDGNCYITTCYDKDIDAALTDGPFGTINTDGEILLSFTAIGWVNFVQFSPDASTLCYASKYHN
jgi:WD40 repeat protein